MYSCQLRRDAVALTMITSMTILAVTSNVVLSLGMVGALSIVRFRTAIKEPMDIAFLFWSIAAGIVLSAGHDTAGGVRKRRNRRGAARFVNRKAVHNPFIAVVSCADAEAEQRAVQFLVRAMWKRPSSRARPRKAAISNFTAKCGLKATTPLHIRALRDGWRKQRRTCQLQRRLYGVIRITQAIKEHRPRLRIVLAVTLL